MLQTEYFDFINTIGSLKEKAEESDVLTKYTLAKDKLLDMPIHERKKYFKAFLKLLDQKHEIERIVNVSESFSFDDFYKSTQLVQKKVRINPKKGKPYTATRWVKPKEVDDKVKDDGLPEGKMRDLFGDIVDVPQEQPEDEPEKPFERDTPMDLDLFDDSTIGGVTDKMIAGKREKVIAEQARQDEKQEEIKRYNIQKVGDKKFFGKPIKASKKLKETLKETIPPKGRKQIYKLPINLLYSTSQQRKDFDDFDHEKIETLAENIKEKGQLNPIEVMITDSGLKIISGERRSRAMNMLGMDKITAFVYDDDLSEKDVAVMQAQENMLRENLNPVEEAFALNQLMKHAEGKNKTEKMGNVGKIVGKSVTTIRNRLKLIDLDSMLLDAVKREIIPLNVAYMLAKVDFNAQRQFFQRYNQGKLTIPALKDKVEHYIAKKWNEEEEKKYQGRFFKNLDNELDLFRQAQELQDTDIKEMQKFKSKFRRTLTKFNKFLSSVNLEILPDALKYETQITLDKLKSIKNNISKIETKLRVS